MWIKARLAAAHHLNDYHEEENSVKCPYREKYEKPIPVDFPVQLQDEHDEENQGEYPGKKHSLRQRHVWGRDAADHFRGRWKYALACEEGNKERQLKTRTFPPKNKCTHVIHGEMNFFQPREPSKLQVKTVKTFIELMWDRSMREKQDRRHTLTRVIVKVK